jgi:hypothetical protein
MTVVARFVRGEVMESCAPEELDNRGGACNERFLKFIRLLARMNTNDKLFPKPCRACGTTFDSFAEYLSATIPKGHTWEDCEEVMRKPFTMLYRHCTCGNTLVLTLTEDTFPSLREFWAMLREEAELSQRPLNDVVKDFAEQCDQYMFDNLFTGEGGKPVMNTCPDLFDEK